ncbi:thioredoxin domain-containing protein [Candidatus Saccharibacteria bacterium]|nr:thioredoxin domain-containing protein [Candidatus Saccharibacteria bacterium]
MRKERNWGAIITAIVVGVIVLGTISAAVFWKLFNSIDFKKYVKSSSGEVALIDTIIPANEDNGGIGDHVKGSADAPVVMFEYADYQCSGCATANPRVNKLIEEYDGKLAVVYRNFLLSYHQNGTAAASAAEAAGLQGYWKEYADLLFANQSVWASASGDTRTDLFVDLFNAASDGAGDVAKFKSDMNSSEVKKKINFDMGLGQSLDIPGTPSFYIDGERIDMSEISGEDGFLKLLREKIDAKLAEN